MSADEIRAIGWKGERERVPYSHNQMRETSESKLVQPVFEMQREIAAQLAELNATLKPLTEEFRRNREARLVTDAIDEQQGPMGCGHAYANLQPTDEGPEACIVCFEIAELRSTKTEVSGD